MKRLLRKNGGKRGKDPQSTEDNNGSGSSSQQDQPRNAEVLHGESRQHGFSGPGIYQSNASARSGGSSESASRNRFDQPLDNAPHYPIAPLEGNGSQDAHIRHQPSSYRATSSSPSGYYNIRDVQAGDSVISNDIIGPRGVSRSMGDLPPYQPPHTLHTTGRGHQHVATSSYYGDPNPNRRNLVEDDPMGTNPTVVDHFKLSPSPSASGASSSMSNLPPNDVFPLRLQGPPQRALSSPTAYHDGNERQVSGGSEGAALREQRRSERARDRRARAIGVDEGLSSSYHRPTLLQDDMMLAEPRSATSLPANLIETDRNELLSASPSAQHATTATLSTGSQQGMSETSTASISVENQVVLAKEHANALERSARIGDTDVEELRNMLDTCKVDQERLQLKLSTALEEAGAIDNVEELFAVNDRLCSAIDAGKVALERSTSTTSQKKASPRSNSDDGPTIELLVENEDVFSLICMLRAPNDKKIAAALALMKFARENEILRNEIRSSGGMHSFLTLFRTKGSNHKLKIVACMAVAYILPSFVVSSQTSSSIGLKIVECLRFLAVSQTIDLGLVSINRAEMLKAASMGVNVLWINAIQPLLLIEGMHSQPKDTRPALRPSSSLRIVRGRGKAGGGMFDQGQEKIEICELTELAISLITYMAKMSSSTTGDPLDVGYNIVEQVCEVDAARPIAVREGLLATLVEWTRSKDINKVRPAVSALRYLVSINDEYMAGWIHSQVVNEGGIGEIVNILNGSVGHDTRVAVSEMLSALCIAPHTRAAVVEARCVGYLVALLFEHNDPESELMVYHAANALFQLAAGSMVRATALSSNGVALDAGMDLQGTVITDILEGWAHGSLAQIAISHSGKLRSVSVEALRVLSEDIDQTRQTRLQLCGAGAGRAFGKTLKDDGFGLEILKSPEISDLIVSDSGGGLTFSIMDIHEALRGAANLLEPIKDTSRSSQRRLSNDQPLNSREMLIKGCVDLIKSGALESVLALVRLPYSSAALANRDSLLSVDRLDLVDETCRLLANVSPLLLTEVAAAEGCAMWSSAVYDALHSVLTSDESLDSDAAGDLTALQFDALKGLGALAHYEPMRTLIIEKSLPKLLALNNLSGDKDDLSNAAGQVLLSLGFTDDEITVQKAGNDPKLLVDWFCLQRSLLFQAMARVELKQMVAEMWRLPFSEIGADTAMKLIRQTSGQSNLSNSDAASDLSEDSPVLQGLFENFTRDRETLGSRETVLEQYNNVYGVESESISSLVRLDHSARSCSSEIEYRLMKAQPFPLNSPTNEKEWILAHSRAIENPVQQTPSESPVGVMPKRLQRLLDSCFPSTLLRDNIIPFNDLRTRSNFNFRAFVMPQRRYFSFAREGRLLARLCEKQAATADTDDMNWCLSFSNSSFAGEFVESLVQTLYLCPMISCLSFARSPESAPQRDFDEDDTLDDGGLLANLAGSLPPWVSYLTFDGVLRDGDLRSLVTIINAMGQLSGPSDDSTAFSDDSSFVTAQNQGNISFIAICNSPQITQETWSSFFSILGSVGPIKRQVYSSPLSMLTVLDLKGNEMGDELAARVIELVHSKDSGCILEQLDLSGNRIGRGTNVIRVLKSYVDYYRYEQRVGASSTRAGWKSSLHTLLLSRNDLFLGRAALEIFALLKNGALYLRVLDLSDNGLESYDVQILTSLLLRPSSLCKLDLSRNKFSHSMVDSLLSRITAPDAESTLSFLILEKNDPPIKQNHRESLGKFLRKSRRNAILRLIKKRESDVSEEFTIGVQDGATGARLENINENDTSVFNDSFSMRRRSKIASVAGPLIEEHEGNNMITVLFSAPLVFADDSNKLHPFAKLDFDMERELLWQCMKEASRDIELSFDSAHHSRLLATLAKRCTCLHYSGHGHPHFLPFEDGMGGPNWLNVANIKRILVSGNQVPFKFVFVSACHSGLAGETFASAGVPHVVCCQQEQELKDTAALAFTRSFYLALAVGHTVRESFEQGCKAVRASPNLKDPEKEMEKFVLLPHDGNHDVPVFRAKPVPEWPKQSQANILERGRPGRRGGLTRVRSVVGIGAKSSEIGTRNMMQEDPAPSVPQFFIGREVDMYYILTALLKMKKRLVNVLGEPGIGRSSLVCGLCHYINERASTITEIEHIYFIKPKHGGRNLSCRSLLQQLLDKIKEAGNCRSCEDDSEVEGMLETICKSLKNDKALIVFDRTELLEKSDDAEELPMILSSLLYDTKFVKIVLTGKHSLGQPSIGGQVEHPYELGALNIANSIRLFGNLCPHLHTPSERELLFSELNDKCGDCAQLYPSDRNMGVPGRKILSLIGDGIPAKIEKAAYSISKEELAALRHLNF